MRTLGGLPRMLTQEKPSPLALGFARILAEASRRPDAGPIQGYRRPAAALNSSHRSTLATSAAAIKAAAGT